MKKQILAIDDDLSIRLLIEVILRSNYEIITKEKGLDAIIWMEKGNIPDLILADLEMQGMNSMEFITRIRQSGYFRSIPMIALSSNPHFNKEDLRKLNVQDFIVKPFNPKELHEKIERNLTILQF